MCGEGGQCLAAGGRVPDRSRVEGPSGSGGWDQVTRLESLFRTLDGALCAGFRGKQCDGPEAPGKLTLPTGAKV